MNADRMFADPDSSAQSDRKHVELGKHAVPGAVAIYGAAEPERQS